MYRIVYITCNTLQTQLCCTEICQYCNFCGHLVTPSHCLDSGNKFSTTWRPVGDYVHLKIQFLVQDTSLQITGPSYILWANENYAECCKVADQIAAKEAEEEEEDEHDDLDEGQKVDEIIRYIR